MQKFSVSNFGYRVGLTDVIPREDTWVTPNTTILEIMEKENGREILFAEIDRRIEIAPNKKVCIQNILEDLEPFENVLTEVVYVDGFPENYRVPLEQWPINYLSYQMIKNGINGTLNNFAHLLVKKDESGWHTTNFLLSLDISEISNGAALAYLHPYMKMRLAEIDSQFEGSTDTILPKINWTGTPQEAAYIFSLLMENGYIENITKDTQKAKVITQLFNIKSQKNTEISAESMRDYFGRNLMSDPLREIKMRKSDNFGK